MAVLADIHANIEALNAVLGDLKALEVERTIVIGDIVGYGPDPGLCIERIRNDNLFCLVGNHDRAVALGEGLDELNEEAEASISWTKDQLSSEDVAFLADLPLERQIGGFHFVHGSPHRPAEFSYVLNEDHARQALAATSQRIVFLGHSHIPAIFEELEFRKIFTGHVHRVKGVVREELVLDPSKRYIINVGSVGQPRDGDPRAAYGLLDLESGSYRLMRVYYDVESVLKKMRRAGLPESLAHRLMKGG